MADNDGPRPNSQPIGLDLLGRAQRDEFQSLAQGPDNSNPFGVPEELVLAAASSDTDALQVIERYIDSLPPEFYSRLPHYLAEQDGLNALRWLVNGLFKIREGEQMNQQEVEVMQYPTNVFKEVIECLEIASYSEPISMELERSVRANIIEPLKQIETSFLAEAAERALVRIWARGEIDRRWPDEERGPAPSQ